MPKIDQTHTIEISPERFLNACSVSELFELDRLIQPPRYQDKIQEMMTGAIIAKAEHVTDQISPGQAQVAGKAISKYCSMCGMPKHLSIYQGHPTCGVCIAKLQANQ